MSKISKPITENKLPSMFGTAITRMYLKENPVTDHMIEYLCDKLIEYSCNPSATFVGVFIKNMRIPHVTFWNWTKKYPQLKAAAKQAEINIGYNRMEGSIMKRFDRSSVLHSQYRFGKEWQEDDDRAAKKQDQSVVTAEDLVKEGIKYGVYQKMPDAKEVPEKGKK